MLFANRPYDHYISQRRKTRCCGWVKHSLGNIVDLEIEEIWHGEKAREIRESIEDGSFRFCIADSCPLIGNKILPDLTPEEFDAEKNKWLKKTPHDFNLAYDYTCNHACPSCRDNIFKPSDIDKSNAAIIAKNQ